MNTGTQKNNKNKFLQILAFIGLLSLIILAVLLLSEDKLKAENPYVLDIESLNKIDPKLISHELVQKIRINCEYLFAVATDSEDMIYVASDSRITKFNPYGSEMFHFAVPEPIRTLDIDHQGRIFAASVTRIYAFSSDGIIQNMIIKLSDTSMVTSIAVSENHVFIADAGNRIVAHYDTSGSFIQYLGGKDLKQKRTGFVIPSPFFDLDLDKDKTLWVVNPGMHTFENFTFQGELIRQWGTHSSRVDGFCGCCNPSHFAIIPGTGFVTTEKGLVRVKIYDGSGTMQSVVAGPEAFERHTTGLDVCIDSKSRIIIAEPASKSIKIFGVKGGRHEG